MAILPNGHATCVVSRTNVLGFNVSPRASIRNERGRRRLTKAGSPVERAQVEIHHRLAVVGCFTNIKYMEGIVPLRVPHRFPLQDVRKCRTSVRCNKLRKVVPLRRKRECTLTKDRGASGWPDIFISRTAGTASGSQLGVGALAPLRHHVKSIPGFSS